jgi:hypothetical protein
MIPLRYIGYNVSFVYIAYVIHARYLEAYKGRDVSCTSFNPTTELFRYSSIFAVSAYLTGLLICVNRLVLCEVADKGLGIITAYHGASALMVVSIFSALYSLVDGSKYKCEDFMG